MLRYAELLIVPFDIRATHVIRELLLTTAPITARLSILIFPLYVGIDTLIPRDATAEKGM